MKKNKELAKIFDTIADGLEYKGELQYKVIAYRKAARVLEELTEDIEELYKKDKLRSISGIGEGIEKKIKEYIETGKMKKYEEVLEGIPPGLLELLSIQNLGPKTLAVVNKELGVKNLEDLKRVIENGSLVKLFRMGEKKVENIKKGIELYEQSQARIPINEALTITEEVIFYLKKNPKIKEICPSGSLRRYKETIGDIDILITCEDEARSEIIEYFTKYPKVSRVLAAGDTKASVMIGSGREARQVDIRIVKEAAYGAALQYFTGSKAHNIKLRSIAKEKGLKISEYGVFKDDKMIAGKTEKEVYKAIGLSWIPPELREDRGEIESAQNGKLPNLIELKDIKGDFQIHTNYSDGLDDLETIINACRKIGYQYIGITDHSKFAKYAHGLDEERLKKQWQEIDKLSKRYKDIKILKGIEVDILPDESLDFSDEILKECDIVVAAIHQGFKKKVTERLISAIKNRYVHIIAHPSGRLISKREGYEVDIEKVLEYAKRYNKILELNAYPDRLDLDELHLRKAKNMGIKIAINTDAHGVKDLTWMRFGVGIARRAWLEKEDVINTWDFLRLRCYIKNLALT